MDWKRFFRRLGGVYLSKIRGGASPTLSRPLIITVSFLGSTSISPHTLSPKGERTENF
jgi:hypothetical protein